MRVAAATLVLAVAGLLAGHAFADTVPVPVPVPVPSTTVPTTTVAVPTIPSLPAPTQPVPSVPAVSAPVPTAPTQVAGAPTQVSGSLSSAVSGTGSALGGTGTSSGSGISSGKGTSSGTASSSPGHDGSTPASANVTSVRASRGWIAKSGPKSRRTTVITFTLRHAARVFFVVRQLSPVCRIAGRFSIRAHAGRNRVRIPGRIASLGSLDSGTYRIAARTRAGTLVRRVTIVVVDRGVPSASELAAARAADVCSDNGRLASAASGTTGASNTSGLGGGNALTPARPSAAGPDQGADTHTGGVLASSVEKAARSVQPLLVAFLALAILLFGVASLPQAAVPGSGAQLLARYRVEIAGLGAAAFVAVVITLLLG